MNKIIGKHSRFFAPGLVAIAIAAVISLGLPRESKTATAIETPPGILKALSVLASHAGVSVTFSQVADVSTNLSLKADVDLAGSTHLVFAPTSAGSVTVQSQSGSTFDVTADSATNINCPDQIIPAPQ
jgi:hypothetical protein